MYFKSKRIMSRLKNDGFGKTLMYSFKLIGKTLMYSFKLIGKTLSPNYNVNEEKISKLPHGRFECFIIKDSLLLLCDITVKSFSRIVFNENSLDEDRLIWCGNYLAYIDNLSKLSTVYSFGVSRNISFDEALVDKCGVKIYLFDPTSPAIEFMNSQPKNDSLVFESIGLWTETKRIKFFIDRNGGRIKNLSALNIFNTNEFMEADCKTLVDIMCEKKHHKIDLLKLDIEGAALPVLIQLFNKQDFLPKQIIAELEIPRFVYGGTLKQVRDFFGDKRILFKKMKKAGYKIYTHGKAEFTAILED